jgi:hypothetical protein
LASGKVVKKEAVYQGKLGLYQNYHFPMQKKAGLSSIKQNLPSSKKLNKSALPLKTGI